MSTDEHARAARALAEGITGEAMFSLAMGWTRLSGEQRGRWAERAKRNGARGGRTSAQAEYMADRLRSALRARGRRLDSTEVEHRDAARAATVERGGVR